MLKRKITQADYDKLSDSIKFEYKKGDGDVYLLEVDDATDLLNARDNEKREKEAIAKERDDLKKELKIIKESNSNWETMEASYKGKIANLENEVGTLNSTLTGERRERHTSVAADKVAARFTVPSVMKPLIMKRLDIDARDPSKTVVLDANGKPSALTLEDLTKEFVDNPEYKAIVVAHKGSGSAGVNLPAAPGNQTDTNNQPKLFSKMTPAQIAAERKAVKEAASANAGAA